MKKITVNEFDVIYISYDEPNADRNYADLCSKIPWAKRVHGVKGSDAAHKAAANLSETERFITVDGDNVLTGNFLNQVIEVEDNFDLDNCVISWPSYNIINGLMYGNGGIKCWPKHVVLGMKTHEAAPADNVKSQIDFCWDLTYLPLDKCFSEIHNNGSPLQAWRSGFREGVKMSLEQGERVSNRLYRVQQDRNPRPRPDSADFQERGGHRLRDKPPDRTHHLRQLRRTSR